MIKKSMYEVQNYIDEQYPPTYTIQCLDDDTVPPMNADILEEELEKSNIPHFVERFENGNHGFGLGSDAPGGEWVKRAITFLEEQK